VNEEPDIAKPLGTPPTNVASVTTPEEDRTTAAQRKVNIMWEATQATIAIGVSLGTVATSAVLILRDGAAGSTTAFLLLSNAFFMIVTSYFQRTNHTRVGGIGQKQEGQTR